MEYKKIVIGILFFIGGYILVDTLINIIRIDVEQDVQETILKQSLQGPTMLKKNDTIPKKPEPNFLQKILNVITNNNNNNTPTSKLEAGKVYTPNNQAIWKDLYQLDNTKVGDYQKCNKAVVNLSNEIKQTMFHQDQMMDVYRNDMVYKYDMDDRITNMENIDPYDPVIYASYQNQRKEATESQPMPTQILRDPLIGHTYVSNKNKPNPMPVKYPILSDTHYMPNKVKEYNYIPPAVHCDLVPSINKTLSTNLISDKLLNERVGSHKTMQTNSISNDFIPVDEIIYDVKELVPQYHPLDNNLYKVEQRKPVQSMVFNADDNVCGFDNQMSRYSQLEANDLKETTSA